MRTMDRQNTCRIMIVDDDDISRELLADILEQDYQTYPVPSGEACLDSITEISPAIVLLDIAMDGIDGYETCRRLRDMDTLGAANQPVVMFVSAHDSLEERLKAYDSGGDDFFSKPIVPEEVRHKVQAIIKLSFERQRLQAEKDSIHQMAMGFITQIGETAITLHFIRESIAYTDVQGLANLTLCTAGEFGLQAHLQLSINNERQTFSDSGRASPLVESVFSETRDLGRMFQFRRQFIINHSHVSLLVKNMPIDDEELCGRLRDQLALIIESCEARVLTIIHSTEIENHNRRLMVAENSIENALSSLRDQYRKQRTQTTNILHEMNDEIIGKIFLLGLTEDQEEQMQRLLASATEETLDLFSKGLNFDVELDNLMRIINASQGMNA